jgi:hypothetical protein
MLRPTASSAHAQTQKAGTSTHQEVDFKTAPQRIREALLDAKQFSAFTKASVPRLNRPHFMTDPDYWT